MRQALIGLVILSSLSGCSSEPEQQSTVDAPVSCSGESARLAAVKVVTPILNKITDPNTRDQGCSELDEVLKDRRASLYYDEFKPKGCDWDYGEPYEQVKAILTPRGGDLSKLCDWERKDAERSFQQQGEQVLQSMSPEDRETLQRAYEGR